MNVHQLMMLRSLEKKGWPCSLGEYLLSRCGASREDWNALLKAELVEARNGQYRLTREGLLAYKREKVGRYF